jgi:hypothetical protein
MNAFDDMRLCKAQQIIIAFQIGRPVLEPFAAVIFFSKAVALYHGAHGTVYNKNALLEFFFNAHVCSFFNREYTKPQSIKKTLRFGNYLMFEERICTTRPDRATG